MKITKLEKKKRLYLMELDESDRLYITEDTIVRFMLSKQKEISQEELDKITHFAQFSYGKNLALYHLSFKSRTTKEVKDYLQKYEIRDEIIPQVIADLKENKWLDDRQYTWNFINSNQMSGDKGAYALKQKLIQKGVDSKLIEDVLSDFDLAPVAQRTAEKLLRKYKGKLPPKALEGKIIQNLSSKGFSYSQGRAAFDLLDIEEDEENTQELLEKDLEKQYRKYSRKYEGYELRQRLIQALARKGYSFSDIDTMLRDYL
ncbi:Regulatory protein recX [Streptococcus sp. DD10]|uniref:recombination regulator RecX n=1 Tax=Streptococcus sp. DD10 TaxID=1777878 RepID=UPI000797E9E7|nr:recombination regulator RecX [Streptococcus sp. DD10]KXT74068.1 Regulatory protein recX [Streptococcus sp. DD10]